MMHTCTHPAARGHVPACPGGASCLPALVAEGNSHRRRVRVAHVPEAAGPVRRTARRPAAAASSSDASCRSARVCTGRPVAEGGRVARASAHSARQGAPGTSARPIPIQESARPAGARQLVHGALAVRYRLRVRARLRRRRRRLAPAPVGDWYLVVGRRLAAE
eukprot:2708941-Prymnesium_polylepis.1